MYYSTQDGWMPLVNATNLSNSYFFEGYEQQQQNSGIVPLVIRDSQDLNSIFMNSQLLFNTYIDLIVDADFKQAKFKKTVYDANGWPPMNTVEDKNDAKH